MGSAVAEVGDFKRVKLHTLLSRFDDATDEFEGTVDPDVGSEVVKRLRRRGAGLMLAGALMLGAYAGYDALAAAQGDRLLADGARTQGTVVDVDQSGSGSSSRSPSSIVLQFEAGGTTYRERVHIENAVRGYHLGDTVTVVFDRADPNDMRTLSEPNHTRVPVSKYVLLPILVVVLAAGGGLVGAVRWTRRGWSLRRTGWRAGRARFDNFRSFTVDFDGETRKYDLVLPRAVGVPDGWKLDQPRPVWIAGHDRAVTVLFADGPFLIAARRTG